MSGFRLTRLSIEGPKVASALIEFLPGLNVISGASDTGKSYILSAIDFMLGSSEAPKQIPEADGYDRIYLGLKPHSSGEITLRRAMKGGAFNRYQGSRNRITDKSHHDSLGAVHSAGNINRLSGYLLAMCGLDNKWVRENKFGKKRSLSYRDISLLTLVDEQRIIAKRSPIYSEQYMWETVEQAVFQLLLTGIDDSAIVREERPGEKKSRIAAQMAVVDEIISLREKELPTGSTRKNIMQQLADIELTLTQASTGLGTLQSELSALESKRQHVWERLGRIRSRMDVVENLLARFALLSAHYLTDRERLEAIAEGGSVLAGRVETNCPECGQKIEASAKKEESGASVDYALACEVELAKIKRLEKGLATTIKTLNDEKASLSLESDSLREQLRDVEVELERKVRPRTALGEKGVSELLRSADSLRSTLARFDEIGELRQRRGQLEKALTEKKSAGTVKTGVDTRNMVDLCGSVEELLNKWKYPELARVVWDSTKNDFVIGSRDRGSLGKGYRALTHAAFSVAFMQYCRSQDLPHPGLVILDSPLTQLREKDEGLFGETISTEMKDAFYEDLSKISGDQQVIVLENYDPRPQSQKAMNFIHFSKKVGVGRYGLFPVKQ